METAVCIACQKPKANYKCGLCGSDVCKACVEFVQKEQFSLMKELPEHLANGTYCGNCYDHQILAELEKYNATVAKAKEVFVFYKDEHKVTRYFKKTDEPVKVDNCADREEAIMKLAFMAASLDLNGLIDTDLIGHKERKGAYQTTNWSGSAFAAYMDPAKLKK